MTTKDETTQVINTSSAINSDKHYFDTHVHYGHRLFTDNGDSELVKIINDFTAFSVDRVLNLPIDFSSNDTMREYLGKFFEERKCELNVNGSEFMTFAAGIHPNTLDEFIIRYAKEKTGPTIARLKRDGNLANGEKAEIIAAYIDDIYKEMPEDVKQFLEKQDAAWEAHIRELAALPNTVAIGETGLDYNRVTCKGSRLRQAEWFKKHLLIAREYHLPLVLHIREADEDALRILESGMEMYGNNFSDKEFSANNFSNENLANRNWDVVATGEKKTENEGATNANNKPYRGVVHCFSGDYETAMRYINLGFVLGIGGAVTYNEYAKLQDAVMRVPLSTIIFETDAPYVKTSDFNEKHPGLKVNTSIVIPEICKKIAELRNCSEEELMEVVYKTSVKLFSKET